MRKVFAEAGKGLAKDKFEKGVDCKRIQQKQEDGKKWAASACGELHGRGILLLVLLVHRYEFVISFSRTSKKSSQ